MQPLWTPSPKRIEQSELTRYLTFLNDKHAQTFDSYQRLHAWSVSHPADFWQSLVDFFEVQLHTPATTVFNNPGHMLDATWFEGATLNYAEHLLRCHDDKPAIIFRGEYGAREVWTYPELKHAVGQFANTLKAHGVTKGDRVATLLPNCPQTIIVMLAAASIGATFASCSPDFGFDGVLDRFGQIKPKVLVACDGYTYNGKTFDIRDRVVRLIHSIDSLELTVIHPFAKLGEVPGAMMWLDALSDECELSFTPVAFNHPLFIMFSSGTTGKPKCIVHGTGGTLMQHLKELVLHTDLKHSDVFYYFTTCGWMMWNWWVTGLATGATLISYDGSPFYPSPGALFTMAEQEGITIFGTGAKYIQALQAECYDAKANHDFAALKCITSTASPLLPENFEYVYSHIKSDLQLSSISGGTDIISCFALGCPNEPVFAGELQTLGLGMDVKVFNDSGQSVINEKGELVCCTPFPSMPVCFWNDAHKQTYHAAYFERFENIWHHGDYALVTKRLGLAIYGRSDATLNPGGVRIGTAEIYRQVETLPEISEALAAGRKISGDTEVILFVVLKAPATLTDELIHTIKTALRTQASPRHVPKDIYAVPDLPRTRSGKISEIAVTKIIHGEAVENTDALANPESLAFFKVACHGKRHA